MWFLNKPAGSAIGQIDISAVEDGILTLSGAHHHLILETSSVNFELKSETERDALITAFEGFLNSMGGDLQIIVRTRELDLDIYLDGLRNQADQEQNPTYKEQMRHYAVFINGLVSMNRILSRNFYIVLSLESEYGKQDFALIKEQLMLKADIVGKSLQRLGMHVRSLASLEVLNLFYSYFNPQTAKTQPLADNILRTMHSVLIAKE
ncbi:MAG: TraC family protein [Gammaproteobacteria bacterium]|nr:TraC family protein [Gammaproteobacteria bacterium]